MKIYLILIALYLSTCIGFGQEKFTLEKASPFTAVQWENNQPIVQFENEWYSLKKLDIYTTKQLIDFCKKRYGVKWKKRFSEDLIEVLIAMGSSPNEKVEITLHDGTQQKNVLGTYTFENRQKVLRYNYSNKKSTKTLEKTSPLQAVNDIEEFQQIIEKRSSYIQVTDYDYKKDINTLKASILTLNDEIDINYLTYELAKIMSQLGDRHSSVKNEALIKDDHATYSLQLPFSIAALQGKAIAVTHINKNGKYDYVYPTYPYIESINDTPINQLIDSLVYRSKIAPKDVKFSRGVSEIQQLGKLYAINNIKLPEQIRITLTNGKNDTIEVIDLQKERHRYYSNIEQNSYVKSREIKKGKLNSISKVLKGNIGYISLPKMYTFERIPSLEQYIDSTFTAFKNTNALIIDLRFNPGGRRDLIQKMASYIIPTSYSPWIANVAYLRTDQKGIPHSSMSSRYLYPYSSDRFNDIDKKAIDIFNKRFKIQREFDNAKFSKSHYMILKKGNKQYLKPIYILVNEHSFSAATVFTSAFKGLPNVKIVGVTTDGSSGNSKIIRLKYSNIRVRISTMLSFQRNGKTLDGNGTEPDIYIPEDEKQILHGKDTQLEKLIQLIQENNE